MSCLYYVEDSSTVDEGIVVEIKGRVKGGSTFQGGLMYAIRSSKNGTLVSKEWSKITGLAILNEDYEQLEILMYVLQNGKVWFAEPKLEKGNKATDWSPAPEDCSTAIEHKFDNLSIGGRNLIVNSAFLDGVTNWGYIGKDASEVDTTFMFNNHPTLKINATGNTEFKWQGRINYYLPTRDITFTTGTTFTMSAWYYVEDKTTFDNGFVLEFKGHKPNTTNANTIMSNVISLEQIIEGKWTKITKTVTIDSDYSECSIYPYVRQNGTVWFADLKLEEGDKATSWTPAPEDY
jgi:hypothetical protein